MQLSISMYYLLNFLEDVRNANVEYFINLFNEYFDGIKYIIQHYGLLMLKCK